MSPFRWSITSCLVVVAMAALARAQVQVRVDDKPSSRAVHPSMVEAAIYLELYGHPDTAHRRMGVRVVRDRVELSGTVEEQSKRLIAQRIAAAVAPDLKVDDRIEVKADGEFPRTESAGAATPEDLKRRFTDVLAGKFPAEILRELTLTIYSVDLDASEAAAATASEPRGLDTVALVVVLEGVVPSVRDQLAMSELLLFGSPTAAAVVNRTYVAHGYVREYKPNLSIRVPFVGLEVGTETGVDLDVGPLAIRTGGKYRAGDDPKLLDAYVTAVRADADLRNAPFEPHVLGGVLTLEGKLKAADKMRAVALALGLKGVRGVVDRTQVVEGGPAYYREADLAAYLRYRLGEHAGVRNIELLPAAKERLKLHATVPTVFHAALATAVIANDAALSELPIEPAFREGLPAPAPAPRK
jgi:osmotically-inducible protein OsmY